MAEYIECKICYRDFRGELGLRMHMKYAHNPDNTKKMNNKK